MDKKEMLGYRDFLKERRRELMVRPSGRIITSFRLSRDGRIEELEHQVKTLQRTVESLSALARDGIDRELTILEMILIAGDKKPAGGDGKGKG